MLKPRRSKVVDEHSPDKLFKLEEVICVFFVIKSTKNRVCAIEARHS